MFSEINRVIILKKEEKKKEKKKTYLPQYNLHELPVGFNVRCYT